MGAKDSDLVTLGVTIRQLPGERGISQEELAHSSGIHRTYMGMIERGERNLGFRNLLRVAKGLALAPSEFLAYFERTRAGENGAEPSG